MYIKIRLKNGVCKCSLHTRHSGAQVFQTSSDLRHFYLIFLISTDQDGGPELYQWSLKWHADLSISVRIVFPHVA